jgi:hypothetical protein
MAIGERAYFLIPKSENLPKRLFNKAFRQIVKFSKNRFFNWQALADKHCHNS